MAGIAGPLRAALIVLLLPGLAACGERAGRGARNAGAPAGLPAQAREGALEVLAIAGKVAGDEALFKAFERDSACKVNLRRAAGPAELLELASQADADLVLASGDTAGSLVAAGLVRALPSPMPTAPEAAFRKLRGAIVEGRRYGQPFRWQPQVLAYDNKLHAQAPSSWQPLFEPAVASAVPDRLAAAEPIAIADAALYLAATRPELQIDDPYALDERQYVAALALLKGQRAALRGVGGDLASQSEGFRNGVSLAPSTPALVRGLQAQGLPVAWTLPAEGGSAQVEIAMLHAHARHPNCALAWIDWALTPAVQARLAAAAGALPVDAAACALEPLAGAGACARDGMDLLPKLRLQSVPQAGCGRNGKCVPYSRWTRDYLALVGE
jgi:putative spermidine/putrescine transport system substrate-binding protein